MRNIKFPTIRKLVKHFFVFILLSCALLLNLLQTTPARADTSHCGTLSGDETWSNAGNVHLISCDVIVPAGITLTITNGTIIKFTGIFAISVQGNLIVQGISTDKVYFTSFRDDSVGGDTNNDGDASTPAKGDWGAVIITTGATASLDQAVLRYGGYGWCVYYCSYYKGMLSVDGSTNVTVQNSVVSYSQNAGIWVDGDDASLTVTNTTLSDNALANDNYQRFGIYFNSVNGTPVFDNLTVQNNLGHGIYAGTLKTVTLTNSSFTGNMLYGAYLALNNGLLTGSSGNSGSNNGVNGIGLTGAISGTQTLAANPGFPYVVDGTLNVNTSSSLTFEPGSVVKFSSNDRALYVYGSLQAQGTEGNEIVFTSLKDDAYGGDTNNDGDASTPAKGDWGAVIITTGATASLDQAVLRYGGYGWCVYYCSYYKGMLSVDGRRSHGPEQRCELFQNAGIWVDGDDASLTVTNTTLSDNALANDNYQRFGIYFNSVNGTPVFDNLTVQNNLGHGIYAGTLKTVTLTNSSFTGNMLYGAYLALNNGLLTGSSGNSGSNNGVNGIGADGCDQRHTDPGG